MRQYAGALARGEGPPNLYHDVASAYLGVNRSVRGDTSEERVRSLFLGDEELSRVALAGLRRMARRTDLPTLDDLVRLDEDGSISYFILPLLAALEEEERTANRDRARLEGGVLQRALGSFFLAEGYDGSGPAWYRRALRSDPEDVADAFVKVYRSRIRRSSGVDRHLRALTRDESHAERSPRGSSATVEVVSRQGHGRSGILPGLPDSGGIGGMSTGTSWQRSFTGSSRRPACESGIGCGGWPPACSLATHCWGNNWTTSFAADRIAGHASSQPFSRFGRSRSESGLCRADRWRCLSGGLAATTAPVSGGVPGHMSSRSGRSASNRRPDPHGARRALVPSHPGGHGPASGPA